MRANSVSADVSFVDPATSKKLGAYDSIVAFNGDPGGVVSVALAAATKGGPADDAIEAYARELFMRFNREKQTAYAFLCGSSARLTCAI